MDSLLSVVMNNLTSNLKVGTGLSAQLSLTDFMQQGIELKSGQNLLLNIDGSGNIQLTNNLGKIGTLPETSLNIDKNINFTEPVTIQAKISQVQNDNVRLQITNINDQDPISYLRSLNASSNRQIQKSSILETKFSNPQELSLQNIKLSDVAQTLLQKLPISSHQQEIVRNALQQIEIKIQVNNINFENQQTETTSLNEQFPLLQKTAQILNQLPLKLSSQPQAETQVIQATVNQLMEELPQFVGTKIQAVTTEDGFMSEIGEVQSKIPVILPEQIESELEIVEILQQNSIIEKTLSSPLDKILNIIEQLKTDNPDLYQKISAKLPSDNEQMLSNMISFTKAAAKGDVHQWLGEEIIQQLEQQGSKGQTIINDLQSSLQSSHRQSPLWRVIEIPYYIENHMEKIKLAIKQYPDEEQEEESPHQKFGTRFVVDTNFTQLGAFQFDGFSFAKDRRFDLIIRTERDIEDDLCANMMRLFKITLNEVQYTGNIKINLKENFIKISENNNDDKILNQGLFV